MNNTENHASTTSNPKPAENDSDKRRHLSIYLNDHLAGSTTIVNLLGDLLRTGPGDNDVGEFLTALRSDITADRATLAGIMQMLQIDKHRRRTATAWLGEKLGRRKFRLDDSENASLHLLEALELVEVGIEGKRELWRSLAATADQLKPLKGINFDHLIQRAEEQHDRVETVRVRIAKTALTMAQVA
jgi:hypothetical protein